MHRLDRDTSGCLVVAKRRSTLKRLHEALRRGEVGKRYQALLAGAMARPTLAVEARLERQTGRGGESVMRVSAAGKAARSVFHRLAVVPDWTLAEVELHTGRMHQIRAHAAHLGLPVAGDRRYGDPEANQQAGHAGLRRLFLHAAALDLPGEDGARLRIRAPLPADLRAVLETMGMPIPHE
ncbi:MAG: RluA family pseudouridine synthase [Arhodomonas sp.]|nr:RluA family pseudouridine synthase [Arhodomonas sp.]